MTNTEEVPPPPRPGDVRWAGNGTSLEVFDGTAWVPLETDEDGGPGITWKVYG
jgi:hypothetical protein